jgi:hypothetical protein
MNDQSCVAEIILQNKWDWDWDKSRCLAKKSKFVKKRTFQYFKNTNYLHLNKFCFKKSLTHLQNKKLQFYPFFYKNSNGVSSCFPSPKQKQKTTKEKLTHNPFMMIISFSDIKHYVLTLTIDNIIFQK